jgi:hypothetical protein
MRILIVASVITISACGLPQPGSRQDGRPLTTSATSSGSIENGLSYDGCSYPVTVAGVAYAPSPSSITLIAALAPARGHTPVTLEYRLTGGTAQVACGFSHQTLPEIELVSVVTSRDTPLSGDATIENGLPSDGCSYPVTVAGVTYAPSPSSVALITALAPASGHTPVTLEYRLTGGTAQVECGWGSHQTLPEIDVIAVVP